MIKKKKILLSSQDFGYGPTTQMFSLIKHLLINEYQGDIFIKKNISSKVFFKKFILENNTDNIFLVDSFEGEYDKYLGFYDPEIIFEAKRKGKESLFLCNLTFLWEDKFIDKYINLKSIADINFNDIKNHHELIILAYVLADKVYIRNTDGINKNGLLYQHIKNKTSFIGPIIYPKIFNKNKKNFSLIQLGGQFNPLTKESFYETYFKLIHRLLLPLNGKKKLLINPILLDIAQKIFKEKEYEIIPSVGQKKYQKFLSETKLLITPFGINTFFENSYFKTPIFILPEQHIGHIKSIISYFQDSNNIEKGSFLLYHKLGYSLEGWDEKEFIDFLEKEYAKLLKDSVELPKVNGLDFVSLINNFEENINKDLNIFIKDILK